MSQTIYRGINQNLAFDKIYSSKKEMDQGAQNDGVLPRRLVIINYNYGSNGAAVNLAMDNIDTTDEQNDEKVKEIISYDNTVWMKNFDNDTKKYRYDKIADLDSIISPVVAEFKKDGPLAGFHDDQLISVKTGDGLETDFDSDLKEGTLKHKLFQDKQDTVSASTIEFVNNNEQKSIKITSPTFDYDKMGHINPQESQESTLVIESDDWINVSNNSGALKISHNAALGDGEAKEIFTKMDNGFILRNPKFDDNGHFYELDDNSSFSFIIGDSLTYSYNENNSELTFEHSQPLCSASDSAEEIVTKNNNIFTFKNPIFDARGHFCELDDASLLFAVGDGLKLDADGNLTINLLPSTGDDNNSGLIINNNGELQHEVFDGVKGIRWPGLKPYKPDGDGIKIIENGGTGEKGETLSQFTFDLPAWEFDKFGHCVSTENGVKVNLAPGEGINFNWLDTTQDGNIKDENRLTIGLKNINEFNLGYKLFYIGGGIGNEEDQFQNPLSIKVVEQNKIYTFTEKKQSHLILSDGRIEVSDMIQTCDMFSFEAGDGISLSCTERNGVPTIIISLE